MTVAKALVRGNAGGQCPPSQTTTRASRRKRPHYLGHRERLRERFYSAGADALSDYELLEMALFPALPRRDTKPLAKTLIKTFGSFAEVVHAPVARLREVDGVGEPAIHQLKLIAAASHRVAKGEVNSRNALSSWNEVIDYCRTSMAFADKEQFRLLFLDKRNQLIADEVQQTGTVDHTPVYPREVIKRALELSATALDPGAQPPLRRSDALAGGHPDDQGDRRYRSPARHLRARPHHRRQERACESEGLEADVIATSSLEPFRSNRNLFLYFDAFLRANRYPLRWKTLKRHPRSLADKHRLARP
ncbi:DNA repair protein RadC [Bradyrhizobium sp. LM6.10]